MSTPDAGALATDVIEKRLEDQIGWYNKKSTTNQHSYKWIKVIEIIAAALIPVMSVINLPFYTTYVSAGLGVLITILEGLLHLNQYQQNWIAYRSTCEQLKHEKYLFLGGAAPYSAVTDPAGRRALLAERVESLVSQEHAKWASIQQQEPKPKPA
jgi:hypothetical protein